MESVQVTVAVRTKVHLWWTWLRIAACNVGSARRARAGDARSGSFESKESAMLSAEFQHSLTAIAAVAFSMEALSLE